MFVQKYKTCRRKSKKKKKNLKSYPNKKSLKLRKLLIPFSRFFFPEKKFPKKSPPFPNFHKFPGNRRKQVVSNTVISRSLIKCPSPGNERMPATAQFSSRACTLAFRPDTSSGQGRFIKRACTRFVSLCLWDGCLWRYD